MHYNCALQPLQFLNFILYWHLDKIQSEYFIDQVNKFLLSYGSVPDQETIDPYLCLYYTPNRGVSILSLNYINASDHLVITMVCIYLYTSGA